MITLPSKEVQNEFGRIANIVKGGEPVAVTQSGEPTLMILPYAEAMDAQRLYKAFRLVQFMKKLPSASTPMLSLEEINKLVHELRP
ncbi:MAG: type II toxin-antitoxin system Phd/YefM family antitoxin [Candidatus Methylumidiphilus sp.]